MNNTFYMGILWYPFVALLIICSGCSDEGIINKLQDTKPVGTVRVTAKTRRAGDDLNG